MLGASFLLGGLKHHVQEYNRVSARLQAACSFWPRSRCWFLRRSPKPTRRGRAVHPEVERRPGAAAHRGLRAGHALLAEDAPRVVCQREQGEADEAPWPIGLALVTLAGVTVLVALVSEVFVESVQKAAETFGMTPAFVGFIVVALVGGAAEMASAFSGARKNRLDLSVGIALGSASQIALFVAPVLVLVSYFIGPTPMDLHFWPGAVVMILIATLTASLRHEQRTIGLVCRGTRADGISDLRDDTLSIAAPISVRKPSFQS